MECQGLALFFELMFIIEYAKIMKSIFLLCGQEDMFT